MNQQEPDGMDPIVDTNEARDGATTSRRSIGRFLVGGALAGLLAPLGLAEADARRRRKKRRKKAVRCNPACAGGATCVDGVCVRVVGESGGDLGQFALPTGVTVVDSGNIVVADTNNNRLQVFDQGGAPVGQLGGPGSADGQFDAPTGVAASLDNRGETILFVADSGNARIQKFDGDGNHVESFGSRGNGNGQFQNPVGIACSANGTVFVTDLQTATVSVFNENGFFLRAFGRSGDGEGELDTPNGIAVSNAGEVFVADTGNDRIQVFDDNGRFLRAIGARGSRPGEFLGPRGLAFDLDGTLWVVDRGNNRLQQFSADGAFRRAFGRQGSAAGQFDGPFGIAVGFAGQLVVTDSFNDRVQLVPLGTQE